MAIFESKETPKPADQITLSREQLSELIVEAIEAAKKGQPDFKQMGESIGAAVHAGMVKTNRPKVSFGDYIRRVHSTTHPDPKYPNGPALTREYLVNGSRENGITLRDREILLLNRLTHSGRYINRLVEVIVQNNGSEEEVQVRWNCATPDQRFEASKHWKTFEDLLEQVVKAQEEEDAENEVVEAEKQERRRHFGNTKAFREAKEAAGV